MDIKWDLIHIEQLHEQVRSKIAEQIRSPDNLLGGLQSKLDEYLPSFQPNIDHVYSKLD